MVQVPWKGLQKEVRRAGQDPTDGQLHKIRIRAKQLRYAAEAAAPIVGKQATRTARGAARLQTQLGEHHDAVIAEEWLRRRAKGASSVIAFSAGQLASEQRRRPEHVRAHWSSHWRKVNRRARTWLA
jgi:CHAD domain-containing protein